ncbi:MAG: hypothetical protein ABI682_16625 [Acidobacteriota bacterium]
MVSVSIRCLPGLQVSEQDLEVLGGRSRAVDEVRDSDSSEIPDEAFHRIAERRIGFEPPLEAVNGTR